MKRNKILVILILIGILASTMLTIKRMNIESENKVVDITLDYDEMVKLSSQSEEDIGWWFKRFNDLGVGSVTLNEETFESMIEEGKPLELKPLGNVTKVLNWQEDYPDEFVKYLNDNGINKYDVVVRTNDKEIYEFIENGLDSRYDESKYHIFSGDKDYIFLLEGTEKDILYTGGFLLVDYNNRPYTERKLLESSKLMRLGLGYDEKKINIIKESGLEVNLRAYNHNPTWIDEKYINTNFNEYAKYNIKPKYFIFTGEQILGYPTNVNLIRDFMLENNTKVALIETGVQRSHIEQKGIEGLVGALDYNAVRLFSMADYIQERYKFYNYDGAEEIENTLYRAVTERNIRLIYFRPFKQDKADYVTDYAEYERTFNNFKERIAQHNMVLGQASVMRPNYIGLVWKILMGLGVFGGGMLLLNYMFPIGRKVNDVLLILGAIGLGPISYIVPNLSVKLYAMAAAIVFPSLSMVYLVSKMKEYYSSNDIEKDLKDIIIQGTKVLVIMVLISSIGALFVASLLSSTEYLLEMDGFRGVKIVQIIPILVYIMVFLAYLGYKEEGNKDNRIKISDIKEILQINIKLISVILGAVILGIGYIYIARTGHETNVQPSNLEMIGRNLLELKLMARPRNKEFLIAFPAVILSMYTILNKKKLWMFLSGLVIIIGQTSIVNTFSHLRTPMYLSIVRTGIGVLFGIVVGIIYLTVLFLGLKLVNVLRRELLDE